MTELKLRGINSHQAMTSGLALQPFPASLTPHLRIIPKDFLDSALEVFYGTELPWPTVVAGLVTCSLTGSVLCLYHFLTPVLVFPFTFQIKYLY